MAQDPAFVARLLGFDTQACGLGKLLRLFVPQLPHLWNGDTVVVVGQGSYQGPTRRCMVLVIGTWGKSLPSLGVSVKWPGSSGTNWVSARVPGTIISSVPFTVSVLLALN